MPIVALHDNVVLVKRPCLPLVQRHALLDSAGTVHRTHGIERAPGPRLGGPDENRVLELRHMIVRHPYIRIAFIHGLGVIESTVQRRVERVGKIN